MDHERPTQFIDTQGAFADLLGRLRDERSFALDTESNSFHAYFERVCLVQLSSRSADFAVDPFAVDIRPLGSLLADPAVEVVFHAADYDIRSLKREFGFEFRGLFDTMLAAKVLGRSAVGLAALVHEHFGVALAKEHQRSDWGHRPLSAAQIAYAYADTRFLLPLRDRLGEELARAGLVAEASAAFVRQAACAPSLKRFDAEGYRKLRGYRALDEPGRAVARALYLLREECARASNRPPFKIYGDDAILELARQRPSTLGELARVRGVGGSTVKRNGEEIVAAIAAAPGAPG
jgi:ribonuclease D